MKTAIVYYSHTGNISLIVETIRKVLGKDVDCIKISPKKPYPEKGASMFFWGGKASCFKEAPELNRYTFDASKYDRVILATPIWAGDMVPPIRTFIREHMEIAEKKVALVTSCSGGDTRKCVKSVAGELGFSDVTQFETVLSLVDPKTKEKEESISSIKEWAAKF